MASSSTDSPFQPRTLQREEATNNLRLHALEMRRQNSEFAEAVRQRQEETVGADDPVASGALPCPQDEATQPSYSQRSPHRGLPIPGTNSEESTFTLTPENYYQRMAEDALTQNGKTLRANATTKVMKCNYVCHMSAYTRPALDLLREILEVKYPRPDPSLQDENTALLDERMVRVRGRLRRALGLG